jgi:hypothetical protein
MTENGIYKTTFGGNLLYRISTIFVKRSVLYTANSPCSFTLTTLPYELIWLEIGISPQILMVMSNIEFKKSFNGLAADFWSQAEEQSWSPHKAFIFCFVQNIYAVPYSLRFSP